MKGIDIIKISRAHQLDKLEVTRLSHNLTREKGNEWELGTPKSIVKPLIDY